MRSRNIKPGFFLNCELAEVDFASRLLFIGLWCYADREGRFEWKSKQIKAAIFPYDNVNIDKLLDSLLSLHVITCHDKVGYIPHFKKHQNPHPHEAKSVLPEKPQQNQDVITCNDMSCNVTKCNADVRIEDVRIEDIKPLVEYSTEFETFWAFYPKKKKKDDAHKAWKKIKRPAETLTEILDTLKWQKESPDWLKQNGQFIPNPASYLNGGGWKDEKTDHEGEAWRII